ncbi:Protein of unknown function [Desulfuromusa kysingii]|uniref:DUF3014 domain-containing protein n=1 Tax=Desulfuromusa kysingii TaxID=37625 RepID=A0A1H3YQJ2_9BACT|nr:DUF3014 domain-containing protein [Desulfuromusa kysingii]SEA13839.1 Protein of unknown function [Desulfuromusa kysingii]
MNRTNLIIFVLVLVVGAFGLNMYFQSKPTQEQITQNVIPVLPPEPIKKPIVHYPVLEPKEEPVSPAVTEEAPEVQAVAPQLPEALPPVQKSDQSIKTALNGLFGKDNLNKLFFNENFIQKFVATVDNLPEKKLPRALLPIKAPEGKFLVSGTQEAPQTSSRNEQRYSAILHSLEAIDAEQAIKTYTYFYPLFQTAYEQLGYKNAYFNDRLVYVIDHLIETPNPPDPIQLAQPAVLYTYADLGLENRSAGQKILLRLGQEQRTRMLKLLNSYRQKLTNLHPE